MWHAQVRAARRDARAAGEGEAGLAPEDPPSRSRRAHRDRVAVAQIDRRVGRVEDLGDTS